MGRVRAPLVVVLLWTGLAALVIAHLVGPTGPFADATYLIAIFAGPAIAWLGTYKTPGREADPGAHQRRPHGRRGRRLHLAGLHLGRAGARRVARRHLLLRGLPGAGRGDAGDRPAAPSGRPARGRRRCYRRSDRGDGERVGPVERRRPRDRHRHVDVGDDARRTRGVPRDGRRAPGAGAAGPLGAPPPGGPGLRLRGRRGLLARLRPRLPAVPGLRHGVGHPRRGLDGRRHPDCHLHVASSASDASGRRRARARADAPGAARPRHPPAPGPPGPARRHLLPRRGDPPRRGGRRDAHPDRGHLPPDGSSPADPDQVPPGAARLPATPHWRRPGPSRRSSPR